MAGKVADFSGWATKAGLKCTDGRTIMRDAFADQNGAEVPLVWMHGHNEPGNVLGHAILENRPEGVYVQCFFNNSKNALDAKEAVQHKDITQLSIYANKLVEKTKQVFHGKIREVSLVLAGANPGALIDNVAIQHADGFETELEDEAVIYTGEQISLQHAAQPAEDDPNDDDSDGPDAQDVWDSMTAEQQQLAEFLVGQAAEVSAAAHADTDGDDEGDDQSEDDEDDSDSDDNDNDNTDGDDTDSDNQEGTEMAHTNVFDKSGKGDKSGDYTLSHSDVKGIFEKARQMGSVKDAVEDFALQHGIEDIDTLFPEVKSVTQTPEFLSRRVAWVASVMDGCRHTPFTRIKSLMADLTLDEARAKGYVKGTMKREEFFKVSKRVTTPQTVYKKQKLDRDDILDITDFDVVVWLKAELRLMLEEEIARAVLMGDGRSLGDEDKIDEDKIRPIATDDELYATTVNVQVAADNSNWDSVVDNLILERINYRGSGNPTLYTTESALARMLLIKDTLGRRIYATKADLAATLQVSDIIGVEVMSQDPTLLGVLVNLQDYTIGADQGGDLTMFDFFDIDFNQYKYLLETRISGALTKPKSALVLRLEASGNTHAEPVKPSFNESTNTVTIPTDANSVYKRTDTGATLAAAATVVLDADTLPYVTIEASPASGKFFTTNTVEWTFEYDA